MIRGELKRPSHGRDHLALRIGAISATRHLDSELDTFGTTQASASCHSTEDVEPVADSRMREGAVIALQDSPETPPLQLPFPGVNCSRVTVKPLGRRNN